MKLLTDSISNILRLFEGNAPRGDVIAAISTAHSAAEAFDSNERIAQLETQVSDLTAKLQDANLTIDGLRKEAENQRGEDRPDPKKQILLLLMTHGKLTEDQIVEHLGLGPQPVKLALARLRQDGHIWSSPPPFGSRMPVPYSLSTEGRSHLDKTGELR